MTEKTINPFVNAEQRLAKLSIFELSSLYDAVSVARDALTGIINQPRFSRGGDYSGAGAELDDMIDALDEFASAAVQAAQTASLSDPVAVAGRAWLLLKYSARCGDNLAAHAAEAASYAAQLETLKKINKEG